MNHSNIISINVPAISTGLNGGDKHLLLGVLLCRAPPQLRGRFRIPPSGKWCRLLLVFMLRLRGRLAKNMPVFPHLSLFDTVAGVWNGAASSLKGVTIVGVQHLLETTGSLFERFIELGADPESIYL